MTSRRVIRPDSPIWPPNNIFQGKDITPNIDVREAVRVWIELPPFVFEGMRWVPVPMISPPDARGYKIQYLWDGDPIELSVAGAFFVPRDGYTPTGLQIRVTNPDGEIITSDPMPLTVKVMEVVLETPVPARLLNTDPKFQIKPVIKGLDYPFPVPGLVATYRIDNSAAATIDNSGVVTLLANTTMDIPVNVDVDFLGVKWHGVFTLHQERSVPLTAMVFTPNSATDVREGSSRTGNLVRTPTDTTITKEDITYTVNPPGYAEVILNPGALNPTFKALKESATPVTITASYKTLSAVFTFPTILPPYINATGYTLDPVTIPPNGFRVGDKVNLHANKFPANATFNSYFWSSSAPAAVKITATTPSGPDAVMEFLQTGSGATITMQGQSGVAPVKFVTGQVNPKPLPPSPIDLTTDSLDPRITYVGDSVPYFDSDNKLKWSGAGTWPQQYSAGVMLGRCLPEAAGVQRVTKPHFEGAGLSTMAATDAWRYTAASNPSWGATNGVDGEMGVGFAKWFNCSRVVQDDVIIKPATSTYDVLHKVGINHYNGKDVRRLVLRFNVPSPATTETRIDFIVSNSGGQVDMLNYSYKELDPGDYVLSLFRTENTAGDRWVYSMPQLNKSKGARGPVLGTTITDSFALVESNSDVQTLRITLLNVGDGTTITRDVPTGGLAQFPLRADPADNWMQYVATKIEYIIP
jgi:hypothetical protein